LGVNLLRQREGCVIQQVLSPHWRSRISFAMLILLLLGAVLPFQIASVQAAPTCTTVCYVSPTGDDNNSGVDAANALATINLAINSVQIDGTVIIGAGTYAQAVTINKPLTLAGAGRSQTIIQPPDATAANSNNGGINFSSTLRDVTIQDLTVQNFKFGVRRQASTNFNGLLLQRVDLLNNWSAGVSFESSGRIYNVTVDDIVASGSSDASGFGRGFFMQGMYKENIIIRNSTFERNRISGIDLNDPASPATNIGVKGFQIIDNTVRGVNANGQTTDSGIGVLRATSVPTYTSVISGNTVEIYGRFGIEVKSSDDVVVQGNTIRHLSPGNPLNATAAYEGRDLAGIAIGNINNSGNAHRISVFNNTIEGFKQSAASTANHPTSHIASGFGISASGSGHIIANNTISNVDIGVNTQQGFAGTQATQNDLYFGRDTGTNTCVTVGDNTISGALINTQSLGSSQTIATNENTGEAFCSVQAALSSPNTLNGHSIRLAVQSPSDSSWVGSGTIAETLIITKEVTLRGHPDSTLTAPATSTNARIIEVRANNVAIEDLNIVVNQPFAAAGIYAAGASAFDNLRIFNNTIRSTGINAVLTIPSLGSSGASAIALQGNTNPVKSVSIISNTILSNLQAGINPITASTFSRAVWLNSVDADIQDNVIGGGLAGDITYQHARASASHDGIDISNNEFHGAGILLVRPEANVDIDVHDNLFRAALASELVAPFNDPATFRVPHGLLVYNNDNNNSIVVRDNEFRNHTLGLMSGASRNVSVLDNDFWPAPNSTNYTHIQVDTGHDTAGSTMDTNAANSITIQGNNFYGDSTSSGRAIDFQNSVDPGSGYGPIIVGGTTSTEQNHFYAELTQFVRFTDAIVAPSPIDPAAPYVAPAAFSADIEGAYNQYYLPSNPSTPVTGPELSAAQYAEIEGLIFDDVDNNALGLYHLTDGLLVVSESSLSFSGYPDSTLGPETFDVSSGLNGLSGFDVSISDSQSWLSCTPSNLSGVTDSAQTVACSVDTTGLSAGSYTGVITVTATGAIGNSPSIVSVDLTVKPYAAMSLSNSNIVFSAVEGDPVGNPASSNINVSHSGPQSSSTFTWSLSPIAETWLACTTSDTTLGVGQSGQISCSADPSGLTAGVYNATVTVSATSADSSPVTNGSQTINVQLVIGPQAAISVDTNNLSYNATAGDTVSAPASQNITLSHIGVAGSPSVDISISSDQAWFSCTLNGAIKIGSGATRDISCVADPSGLAAGTYTAIATISGVAEDNSTVVGNPISINATLNIAPQAELSIDVSDLNFSATLGQASSLPASGVVVISNSGANGSTNIDIAVSGGAAWLTCQLDSSAPLAPGASTNLVCATDPSSLAVGTYTTSITINATAANGSILLNSSSIITITLVIAPQAELSLDQTSISFSASQGDATSLPLTNSIEASNIGGTGSPALTISLSGAEAWLNCSIVGSSLIGAGESSNINCSANPSGLAVGTYTSVVTVTAVASDNSSVINGVQSFNVTLEVSEQVIDSYVLFLAPVQVAPVVVAQSDLVVEFSISGLDNNTKAGDPVVIEVKVTNQGTAAAEPFWVDLYTNPSSTPTANDMWHTLCSLDPCHGIAWAVAESLQPGQSITLSSASGYSADHSNWPGWLAAGTHTIAVFVDSYGPFALGNNNESNEANNLSVQSFNTIGGTNPAPRQAPHRFPAR
jgi:hypothetical protein